MVGSMSVAASVVTKRRNWWVRSRAWIAILIIVPFAVAAVVSPPRAPEGTWIDNGYDFVGWIMFMVGAGFRWWATLYIGGRKLDTVVAEGPYSVCRNPLYVGTFLMGLGIAFFLQSLTFAVGIALAATFYLSVTVPAEEIMLREKFGQTFVDYCRRVPRYWPRLRNFHTSAQLPVSIRGLRAEAVRSARWIWLPVLCEVVTHLRIEQWWPRLLHLP
jgi:protein-S-isoprenylcysteine O-methyltransferase Ste14